MFGTAVVSVLVAIIIGLIIKGFCTGGDDQITWSEFAVVGIGMALFITPSVLVIGSGISVAQILSYEQFVNGVEVSATKQVRECKAGHAGDSWSDGQSNCQYTYVSGSYSWEELHWREVCSGSGENKSCHQEPYYVTESAYIYTPYATTEHYSWRIDSSMGAAGELAHKFPGVSLDEHPAVHPESDRAIPDDIPRGDPPDWTEAKKRLAAGDPRAVTKIVSYDNYILASGDEVLKTYSADIEAYREGGLLPDHTVNILENPITGPSRSQADKVSFVGVNVGNPAAWQRSVMRFNAALGMQLQGDLHVVLVDQAKVPSTRSVPYTQALKAYWQSGTFGKRALAKNGIILVLGVDTTSNTVAWADASTGMPFGNELMIQYLRDGLRGKDLDPGRLFGSPRTVIKGSEATVTLSSPRGAVEQAVFEQAPFKRARMSCGDDTCVGFKDLVSKIEPTSGQKAGMVFATSLIAVGLWMAVGMTSFVSDMIDTVFGWRRSSHLSRGRSGSRGYYYGGRNYYQ